MKKPIAMLMTAIMILSITTSALPLSACAATDDNQYGGGAEDIEALQLAPLNPDFVAYWENPPEASFGYIPPPVDLSHLSEIPVKKAEVPALSLPSSFDWRDYGKVTPAKNQNPCGTCWVFGTTSVLESAVLIGESATYDFSEQSVALCVDRSWIYLYDGSTDPCMAGGWSWLASEVFTKKGSVLESCNPYNPSALNCDGACVCDDCPPIKKVDGYRLATNDGSQIDVIKNAVYNQKPVTVAYQHDSSYEYWDPTWGAIYDNYPCSDYANHLISIIGWDDDVPHPNPSHTGTGAYLVKNSWGTADSWAGGAGVSDGFFYLAYDSSCVREVAYLEYKDHDPAEELLYWDEAGHVSSVGWVGDDSAWMASVFTADQASDLTHVDFWTTSNNAQYEIYVWEGSFGTQLAHQTGSCQEYGYYSIPLSAPISRNAGQQFTVGVKMTTSGYDYPISVEEEYPGRVDPPIQTDVSFIRHTSSDPWEDLADYDWNACLRARMVVGKPDLVLEEMTATWEDGTLTVTYTVSNCGECACTDAPESETGIFVGIYLNGGYVPTTFATDPVPPLPKCDSYTNTVVIEDVECPCGESLFVGVEADYEDIIEECNEYNNVEVDEVECPKLPDLVIEEIWTKERRDRCKVYFVVENIGCAPAPKNHYATLLINDQAVEEKRIRKLLGPGEQYESSFRITVSCTDVIEVCADNFKVVDELDENNNCLVLEEKPDLVIENKREEWVNETHYNVTYVIHNKGTAIAPGGHRTTLYVDGVAMEHKIVPDDLAYCETYTDTFDTVIECTEPKDIIKVCADNDKVIDEINEDNNCLQNEWICDEVVGKPDLVIEKKWEKERRGKYKVYFVVKNIGAATAPKGHHVTLSVDGEEIEHKLIRRALRPGKTYRSSFKTRVVCTGDFDTIEVCADDFNFVDESNETNNCLENEWICKKGD